MKGFGKDRVNERVILRLGEELVKEVIDALRAETLDDKIKAVNQLTLFSIKGVSSGMIIFLISEVIRRKYESRLAIAKYLENALKEGKEE